MKKFKYLRHLINLITLAAFTSCAVTQEITRRNEFIDSAKYGKLIITTKQNETYTLEKYCLGDSTISGVGNKMLNDSNYKFNGEISLNNISRIDGSYESTGRFLLTAGIVTAFAVVFLVFLKKEDDSHNTVTFRSTGCSGYSSKESEDKGLSAAGSGGKAEFLKPEILNSRVVNIIRDKDILSISISEDEVNIKINRLTDINLLQKEEGRYTVDSRNDEFLKNFR